MKKLWHKIWGAPVWVENLAGEAFKGRMWPLSQDRVSVCAAIPRGRGRFFVAHVNGAFPSRVMSLVRWYRR